MMNHFAFHWSPSTPEVTEFELILTPITDTRFQKNVFPFLFDGHTTGVREPLESGRVRYKLMVYDPDLVRRFKSTLFKAMIKDNGQLN